MKHIHGPPITVLYHHHPAQCHPELVFGSALPDRLRDSGMLNRVQHDVLAFPPAGARAHACAANRTPFLTKTKPYE